MKNRDFFSSKYSVITGSGSYIPTCIIANKDFSEHSFYDNSGVKLAKSTNEIIGKFRDITGILERRYVSNDLVTSDIAYFAAADALESSDTDEESLDYIIVAHNFGDIQFDNRRSEFVPTLASRVKQKLDIHNPATVCYDLPFGCAGWLQAVIQADFFIKSGTAKKILVIGAETLSRICDPHDRDSMIYADGAGAIVLEAVASEIPIGIIAHSTYTFAKDFAFALRMDKSNNADYACDDLFLKMNGRALYEQALKSVPAVMKETIEKAGLSICAIKKILIHQANTKMVDAIVKRLYAACDADMPECVMPLTISWLGNSSVATLPTLYDLISKGQLKDQQLSKNSTVLFTAVGAGVNINSLVYKIPA